MAKILIVEDDSQLAEVACEWLSYEHHEVELAGDGKKAEEMLTYYQYDVVILDWNLPGISGLELCQKFRAQGGNTPIIMTTANSAIDEKTSGLDSGADDYLTKPYNMKELCSRVRALLRRASSTQANVLRARDLELDPIARRVTKSGAEIDLQKREFTLLEFLLRHPNQVFPPEALLARVWASESDATPDALRSCIKRVRKKISDDEISPLIKTVHGVGYKLVQ